MEAAIMSNGDAGSSMRELASHEIDDVSGGVSLSAFGYTFQHTGIAGGGSMTTISKDGAYLYYDVCWPE